MSVGQLHRTYPLEISIRNLHWQSQLEMSVGNIHLNSPLRSSFGLEMATRNLHRKCALEIPNVNLRWKSSLEISIGSLSTGNLHSKSPLRRFFQFQNPKDISINILIRTINGKSQVEITIRALHRQDPFDWKHQWEITIGSLLWSFLLRRSFRLHWKGSLEPSIGHMR